MYSIRQICFHPKRLVSYIPRQKTHYEVLEVDPKDSDGHIRRAFVKKSNKLHPDGRDFQKSKKGTEEFMALKEAYDVLRRPEKRKEYDRELSFGREAARDIYYESDPSSPHHIDPNLLNLSIKSPRSQLRPAIQRMSLSDRVGHFFDPAKAMAFEEIERRRVIGMWRSLNLARKQCIKTAVRPFSTSKRDYYEVLGVPRTATSREIKAAFYKLSKQYHPDVPGSDSDKFLEVKEAYDVLRDTDKRREYDTFGRAGGNPYAKGFGEQHQSPYGSYQRVYRNNVNPQEFEQIMKDMDRMFKQFGARNASTAGSQSSRFYGFKREFNQKEFDRIWEELRKNSAFRGGPIFEEMFKKARERSDLYHQEKNDKRWQNYSDERKDREHWNFYQFKMSNYIDMDRWLTLLRRLSVLSLFVTFIALYCLRDYESAKPRKVVPGRQSDDLYNRQTIQNMMSQPPLKPPDQKETDPNQPFGYPESYSSSFK